MFRRGQRQSGLPHALEMGSTLTGIVKSAIGMRDGWQSWSRSLRQQVKQASDSKIARQPDSSESNQTAACCSCHSFCPTNHIQLTENGFHVRLHGSFANE
jgi:Pyruvate/2-oxoacid:ferredoxin oxidoreductase delta subunit